jgi:hypothetical protein
VHCGPPFNAAGGTVVVDVAKKIDMSVLCSGVKAVLFFGHKFSGKPLRLGTPPMVFWNVVRFVGVADVFGGKRRIY